MKVRTGFVSNSSSSSFIIVGTNDFEAIKSISEKMGKYDPIKNEFSFEFSYGYDSEGAVIAYGSWDSPHYIGIDVSKKIKETSYQDLKKEFEDIVYKSYGLKIHNSDIDLHYGESGEG